MPKRDLSVGKPTSRCPTWVSAASGIALLWGFSAGCARTDERWIEDLDNRDPFVRALAAIGIGVQAPERAGPVIPELLAMVDSPSTGLEREAAWVLHELGPTHAQQLLDNLVSNELMSAERRGTIQNALVAGGWATAERVVDCMRGPGRGFVGGLGDVLLAIGEPAVPAIETMLVEEPDVRLQRFAAFLLGRLGPAAARAELSLESAAKADDAELAAMAREALAQLRRGWNR